MIGGAAVYLLALAANWRFAPDRRAEWARSGFVVLMFVGILALLDKPRAAVAAGILLLVLAIAWPWIGPRTGTRIGTRIGTRVDRRSGRRKA
ncbi:MAG: hypothetical protein ACR2JE_13655 [Acidobacteriaceae bacterium]